MERLKHMPFEDLGFAKSITTARYATVCRSRIREGQDSDTDRRIAEKLLERAPNVLITAQNLPPGKSCTSAFRMRSTSRCPKRYVCGAIGRCTARQIAVVCAGTSDLFVAEEAQVTAEVMGNTVETIHVIGVAEHQPGLLIQS
jgi:NCAIR mutase (PurE)-related protein